MKLNTQVIELDTDWLLVTFRGRKPPADRRAFWLHRTLSDWLADHPGRSVARTLAIQNQGALLGVHVWLDSARPSTRSLPVQVHDAVARNVHKEHLEAILQHAYGIYFKHPNAAVLAVINRRGIAVVFDRATEALHVLLVADLRADVETLQQIQNWLSAPQNKYLVVELSRMT